MVCNRWNSPNWKGKSERVGKKAWRRQSTCPACPVTCQIPATIGMRIRCWMSKSQRVDSLVANCVYDEPSNHRTWTRTVWAVYQTVCQCLLTAPTLRLTVWILRLYHCNFCLYLFAYCTYSKTYSLNSKIVPLQFLFILVWSRNVVHSNCQWFASFRSSLSALSFAPDTKGPSQFLAVHEFVIVRDDSDR